MPATGRPCGCLPLFSVLALVTALGGGAVVVGPERRYRDVGYVMPFLMQAWMYASPVAYSTTLDPSRGSAGCCTG